jgi:putative membrane protein
MRRHSLFVLVLAAASLSLYPASALAQHPAGGGGATPATRSDVNNPNSRPNQNQPDVQRVDDKKFLQDAALGGLTEVALGKLAIEKGSSDAVKQFGQKMIDDHTKSNDELKQLATAGSVNVPDALDSKHQSRVDKLAKLSGADFDKAYIKDQLKYHQQNVKEFQQEEQYGSVVEVKSLASKALPTMQQHLELAKDLKKSKK